MNPLLIEVPTELYTERLYIRMPRPGDGKAVYEAIMESIEDLKPWLPFASEEQTDQKTEENLREAIIQYWKREDLRLLVFLKETGEFVASSGLHRIDWSVPKFEIGYWIRSTKSGQGYITEAVEGINRFAMQELGARRIEIRCDSNNLKSRRVPERLGFILEGILKNDMVSIDGTGLRDTCIYAKTR
ncbi:GNAT family N-acetyltransferase [Ectobacillus polymachus]|uniref:GNAT family N-acetyltransferase n=1 Tax=Ectobacillus polymachus TaxID=1508806 RepID=UPI003A8BF354